MNLTSNIDPKNNSVIVWFKIVRGDKHKLECEIKVQEPFKVSFL